MGGRRHDGAHSGHHSEAEVSPFLQLMTTAPRIDLDPAGPTVSVVIPTRNEARNLPWVARRMPANVHEIIVVDGDSADDTVTTARSLWPRVRIVQQTRRGKGNALACGFHAATGDILVMIDADGSMDPGEIPYFVEALRRGADYAKGSRFAAGGGTSDITAVRSWGNRRLNGMTALVHGTAYSDLCYGFNAFWARLLPTLGLDPGLPGHHSESRLWGDGFEVETLINIRVHAAGAKIAEVASYESRRLHGASNLNTFRDGLRVLRAIAVERALRARRHDERAAAATQQPGDPWELPDSARVEIGQRDAAEQQSLRKAVDLEVLATVVGLIDELEPQRSGERQLPDSDLTAVDLTAVEHELDRLGLST
jgi:hypothetical protein